VGRIIGAHPDVVYLPSETFLFAHLDDFARNFHASTGSAQVGALYAERDDLIRGLRSLCDAILTPWLRGGAVERILERTPLHTANLDLIAELYPEARVVHIIRDGRDVARSLAAVRWGPGSAPRPGLPGPSGILKAARRLVSERRKPEPPASPLDELTDAFEWAQRTVDLFVEHVRGGRMDMAAELLDPHVFVQVLMHDQEWSGRGTDVVEKLLALLAADPVLTRPQVRTDIHVALPAVTLVFASDTEDGFESRTLVLHVRARTIVRIAFYGLG
jgi:hypothetical protein